MPISSSGMPDHSARKKKPPIRISEIRLEIVMVRRSLEAAKAISAGNSRSLIASAIMIRPAAGWAKASAPGQLTPRRVADRLAARQKPGPFPRGARLVSLGIGVWGGGGGVSAQGLDRHDGWGREGR